MRKTLTSATVLALIAVILALVAVVLVATNRSSSAYDFVYYLAQ